MELVTSDVDFHETGSAGAAVSGIRPQRPAI